MKKYFIWLHVSSSLLRCFQFFKLSRLTRCPTHICKEMKSIYVKIYLTFPKSVVGDKTDQNKRIQGRRKVIKPLVSNATCVHM